VQNATTKVNSDLINGGMYRTGYFYGHYFLTVPKAGHFVPKNFYDVTEQFLIDFYKYG